MTIEHKMGIPTAYHEIMAGECFWYQEDARVEVPFL